MPGRKCILCGKSSFVTSKEGSNTSFFSFPRDENLRKKWIDVCHNKIDNIITARICSDHFKVDDFLHNKNGTEEGRKKRLKCNVVPSLYLEARGGKQSRNNVSIKVSNTENSKDCSKKRDNSMDTENIEEQNSILQSKRKNNSGIKNNKSTKDQIKRKSISENNKYPSALSKQKNDKELNNKENAKELTKRKNTTLGIKKISKNKNDSFLLKKKSKSLTYISLKKDLPKHKIAKKSINKENKMEIVKQKYNNLTSDALKDVSEEQKPTKPTITKSSKREINSKTSPEMIPETITKNNSEIPDELPKHETSENNKEKISQEIVEAQDTLDNNSNLGTNKKPTKRKSFQSNGMPKKIHKKRIRLGKDDSEDSEESSSECRITNNVSRNKITYKSPSEMAENIDLLNYLNYLKEKSKSSDQPILFWVDD